MARPKKDAAPDVAPQEEERELLPSLQEAEFELKRAMNAYRAFEGAHKALAVLSNLETVANERKAAAAAAEEQAAQARADLERAQADLRAAQAKAAQVVADADAKAEAIIANASASAKAVEDAATARAAELDARADKMTADLLQAQADLDDLQKQAEQARALIARAEAIKAAMQG